MVAHRVLAVSLTALLSFCQAPIHPNSAHPHKSHKAAVTSTKTHKSKSVKLSPQAIKYIKGVQHAQLVAYFAALWISSQTSAPEYVRNTMVCIKSYESGNYSESTHPNSGSGAFQFVPSTWQTYFARWSEHSNYPKWAAILGLPTSYTYAFQAPAWMQDAVIIYALMNGGAHNWDPSYGNDPCTVTWA